MNVVFNTTPTPPTNTSSLGIACTASTKDSTVIKVIKTVLLAAIMLTALLGNVAIIRIVYKKKNMRRTINIFIANMAVSDLFIAVVVIPRILAELYIGPGLWLVNGFFGVFLCKFCFFFTDFSACISITSHAVIALDRFWAIVFSLRPSPITPARRKYIIALIWLFSFVLHSPNLFIYKLHQINGGTFCFVSWLPLDNKKSQATLFAVIFVFSFCIPILLMIVLYSWLLVSLITKNTVSATQTTELRKQRRKEDIRVLRKVVVMVTTFVASCCPILALGFLVFYVWDGELPCDKWGYSFAAYFFFLSNSAVNPCLCTALHDSYRHYVRKMFAWRFVLSVTTSLPDNLNNGHVLGVLNNNNTNKTNTNSNTTNNKY